MAKQYVPAATPSRAWPRALCTHPPKNETIRMKEIDARSATGLAVVTLLECSASAIALVPAAASRWLIIPFSSPRPLVSRVLALHGPGATHHARRGLSHRESQIRRGENSGLVGSRVRVAATFFYMWLRRRRLAFLSGWCSRRRARTNLPLFPPRDLTWLVFRLDWVDKFRGLLWCAFH